MRLRAERNLFWPNMARDIATKRMSCSQMIIKEPSLKLHCTGIRPVGTPQSDLPQTFLTARYRNSEQCTTNYKKLTNTVSAARIYSRLPFHS